MIFPTWLKSSWIPNFLLELSLGSSSSLLLLLHHPRFSWFLFSKFLVLANCSTDSNISFLISSITLSSHSIGWFFCCKLAHYTPSLSMGKSHWLAKTYSSFVALAYHPAASSTSAVSILNHGSSTIYPDRLAPSSPLTVLIPYSSNCSSCWCNL